MKKALPILADKFALRSSDGVETVARSLVELIRPELLDLDTKRASAFAAGDSFIAEARRKHPGYEFAIQSGAFATPDSAGAPFTIKDAKRRIQIGVSDPAIIGVPPGGTVEFFGEGVKKAIDFERTGKPQKWESGEFRLLDWQVPLMPPHIEGGTFEVGTRKLPNIPPRYMRLEVGSRPPIVFPMMEMCPVRCGTHEAEATLSDKEEPLSVRLVFPVGPDSLIDASREVDITLSWETAGKRVAECGKLIKAIDALRRGRVLRVVDIRLDKIILESSAGMAGRTDPFSGAFRRIVSLAFQVEKQFSLSLRVPPAISEEDGKSLFYLDCLLNAREYGKVKDTRLRLVKADGEVRAAQEAFIKGESFVTFTDAPSDYPGYFPLFGQRVVTRDWVRVAEYTPTIPSAYLKEFSEAPAGSEFSIAIISKGPALLRWRDDSLLKNIEVGTLTQ